MSDTSIITEQYVRIHQTPASIGSRLLGAIIDIIIVVFYMIGGVVLDERGYVSSSLANSFIIYVIVLPALLYPVIMEIFNHGRSLGKMICHTRVVKADGSTPSLGSTLLRWLFLMIDSISGIGFFVMLINRSNQRIGDIAAGTIVIHENSYRKVRVSLDEYEYLSRHYHPVYPEAGNLTIHQADIISEALNLPPKRREAHIPALANKVKEVLHLKPKSTNAEQFLTTILHDYQYYLFEEV